ncbi:MAG TPA: hemolysin III family protein [Thermoanaerobaculia bacterium]|nr:hemolysin III family protein [Thermoanaerobaculia bacterium]
MYPGERFNAITHVAGTVLAVAGTAVLVAESSGARRTAALAIYGAMMIAAYLSSALYHSIRHAKAKKVFHVFDHCAIYLLIAGTYTPFTLVTLRGAWGWTIFGVIWGLAAAGIAKDVFLHGRMRVLSIVLYVLMGWMIVIAFGPLRAALPAAGVAWLLAGGIVYTVGIGFFAMSKRVAYTHGLWHLFVIAGSVCHYVAVLRYVA